MRVPDGQANGVVTAEVQRGAEASRSEAPALALPRSEPILFIPVDKQAIRPSEAGVHREGVSQSQGVSPSYEGAGLAQPILKE